MTPSLEDLLDLYRNGSISHGELASILNLSRDQTDAVLKRHGISGDLVTPEELNEQVRHLQKLISGNPD